VEQARNHQSVNWLEYFTSIKQQCPWSLAAWNKGEIDIVDWTGEVLPLAPYQARVYKVDLPNEEVKKLAEQLDEGDCEWLYSFPGYGPFATPVKVLIQQDRATLARLRKSISIGE
jgi:hypothetical protein